MSDKTRLVGLKKGGDKNDELYKNLFVDDSGYRLISSSPKVFSAIHPDDFGDKFYISEDELIAYVDGFIESVNGNIQGVIETVVNDVKDSGNDQALNDPDIKLSLYRSFKSLYDKWISSSDYKDQQSNYFYNTYSNGKLDDRMLYEHFNFVNRCGSDIGKEAVIDFAYLSNLANTKNGQGPTQSLYESITGVLSKNNFNFLPLPGYISYSEKDDSDLVDMFRAFDGPLINIGANPKFVCMFIGGSSRSLDIPRSYCGINGTNFEYKNDSFDINNPVTYPEDFNNVKTGGITAFKVRYGQESQNHFSKLELDQAEFRETQDSLLVIDALTNPGSGSDPTQIGKGNNLYDVNLTRGYTCKVESLGNMQIQPTMFFKLENVPMFRGTYLITDVSHSITPHNVKTTITATRQPIVTVPIVTEALSILDLSLVEVVQTTGGGNVNAGTPSQNTVNEEFDNNVNVSEYKDVPDFDLFLYLSWQQGAGGAAQHYSLWKGNGKYKKYTKNVPAKNIKSNWPGGYVSASGVKASDVENLYETDQQKLAEAFIDVQRQLYKSKRNTGLQLLNSNGENRTKLKYSEIKKIFQKYAKPNEGLSYESLATFGNIENGLQTDTKDTATFKGMFQVNKNTFSTILDNLSPKLGHKVGYTDWVPLDLYVELSVPRILKNFKSFASLAGFGS